MKSTNPFNWFRQQNKRGQELMKERNLLPIAYKGLMLTYGIFYLIMGAFLFWVIKGNNVAVAFLAAGVCVYFALKYLTEWWVFRKVI